MIAAALAITTLFNACRVYEEPAQETSNHDSDVEYELLEKLPYNPDPHNTVTIETEHYTLIAPKDEIWKDYIYINIEEVTDPETGDKYEVGRLYREPQDLIYPYRFNFSSLGDKGYRDQFNGGCMSFSVNDPNDKFTFVITASGLSPKQYLDDYKLD